MHMSLGTFLDTPTHGDFEELIELMNGRIAQNKIKAEINKTGAWDRRQKLESPPPENFSVDKPRGPFQM
jgi:hypothetical protein